MNLNGKKMGVYIKIFLFTFPLTSLIMKPTQTVTMINC